MFSVPNIWENLRADQRKPKMHLTLPRFSPGYEGTENMFYLFYKTIIFCLNKEKDDTQSMYVYFNLFLWNRKFSQLEDSQP